MMLTLAASTVPYSTSRSSWGGWVDPPRKSFVASRANAELPSVVDTKLVELDPIHHANQQPTSVIGNLCVRKMLFFHPYLKSC